MKRWRSKLLLLGGAAGAVGIAIPAVSQEAPESLLPPGFEQSNAASPQQPGQPGQPVQPQQPTPSAPRTAPPRPSPQPRAPTDIDSLLAQASEADLEALLGQIPPPIEIPDAARRSIHVVGPLGPGNWGLASDAFGAAHGRLLSTLMRETDVPLPSRWASILLRRALLSRVPAPRGVHPVDWVAERAWLLLRMGEADGARMLVQAVDVDQFTPKMFSVAVQTALATADPAALCPLVEEGRQTSDEPVWALADSICAALEGEATRASQQIERARQRGIAAGTDLLLTEKVIGAGTNTRRAVSIDWEDVDSLNTYRFGLAAATGADIPGRLLVRPTMRAWHARAPMVPVAQRLASAQTAAALGVFSNASLVEMHSLIADTMDVTEVAGSIPARLRAAYAAPTPAARMEAIRSLWNEAEGADQLHARHILTAVAASRIPPSAELGADVPALIASMLSAGMDGDALRWSDAVGNMGGGAARDQAWAMLAVASAEPQVDISGAWISSYRDSDESEGDYKSKLLVAALAGLGRLGESQAESLAQDMGFTLGGENEWTRMLEGAARARQPGTVALLAAIGMQTPSWRGVPPAHLYRIVRALRQAGRGYEARMIAAEALARP